MLKVVIGLDGPETVFLGVIKVLTAGNSMRILNYMYDVLQCMCAGSTHGYICVEKLLRVLSHIGYLL